METNQQNGKEGLQSLYPFLAFSLMSTNAAAVVDYIGIKTTKDHYCFRDYDSERENVLQSEVYEPDIYICSRTARVDGHSLVAVANLRTQTLIGVYSVVNLKPVILFHSLDVVSGIIDLTSDGCRWEGSCYNGIPCGWGEYYDENDRLVFRGFRYDGYNICYGTYFYIDTLREIPEYEGQISFNNYYGQGKKFNRLGKVEIDGGWMYSVNCRDISVTVPTGTSTRQYHNTFISSFQIESYCYQSITQLHLDYFPYLKTISIGRECYLKRIDKDEEDDQLLVIRNCPQLETIDIGNHSFSYYSRCVIHNLPLLRVLSIGTVGQNSGCFSECNVFIVSNLPCLERISIGDGSFNKQRKTCFENLPSLLYIMLGSYVFQGEIPYYISYHVLNRKCSVSMLNLPRLCSFVGGIQNFVGVDELIIKDVPFLHAEGIGFYDKPFSFCSFISIENSPGCSLYFKSYLVYLQTNTI